MSRQITTLLLFSGALWALQAMAADDAIDQLDDLLTFSSADAKVRGRISGTVELEGYWFQQPAPAFIDASGGALFNPRVTTFLDVQAGPRVYAFAQARMDRGFDPSEDALRGRLDEYAIRLTVLGEGQVSLQAGKFATVVGNWVARHAAWDNAFVNAPLPYENLTGIWDEVAARNSTILLGWAHVRPRAVAGVPATDKYLRLPIIWGPSYATGVAVSGELGKATYAWELKNAPLASRPEAWEAEDLYFRHPTVSGRIGYTPNLMWNFGLSASTGAYLLPVAISTLPATAGIGDYREVVMAQDARFAWHHLQLWAEVFETRFTIPRVGNARTYAYYVEGRYKITPQWFGAVRWNEQWFSRIPDPLTGSSPWGNDVWRIDVASGYRFTPHTQWKIQYSRQHEVRGAREFLYLWSTQLLIRF